MYFLFLLQRIRYSELKEFGYVFEFDFKTMDRFCIQFFFHTYKMSGQRGQLENMEQEMSRLNAILKVYAK